MLKKSPVKPPITTNSIQNFPQAVVAQDAENTRIIVHQRYPQLVEAFLEHKRAYGSKNEKMLYGTPEIFTWQDEISRLVEKRPLVFMGSTDYTKLRNGTTMYSNTNAEWDRNGSEQQQQNEYLTLEEYLSYDEIMLSSLVGVSGPSYFINDGNRNNSGVPAQQGSFEPRGIIMGLVGARFEREDRMDSVHILPPVTNPYQNPRLSQIFQNFFGATRNPKAGFDVEMYKARMRITIDILLLEANDRAKEQDRTAYTYVVGLGLGVWKRNRDQSTHYISAFFDALEGLSLPNITTLEFAYIPVPPDTQRLITQAGQAKGIKVIFSQRNPATKLSTDELLVLSYAWDGNAFPGNEYWEGSLCASGDPAAACMSTIGELHNPLVNPYTSRIKVL